MNNAPTLSTPKDRPVPTRILRCIGSLRGLVLRCFCARYRRVFRKGEFVPQDWLHPLSATPRALLRGCAADLRTAVWRMERRFDALPESWTYDAGSCFERDASGNLQPNSDSAACIRDIGSFQRENPKATLFDDEVFRSGWEAGAKYGQDKSCREGTEEKPCNPPDCKRIPDPDIPCGFSSRGTSEPTRT